MEQNQFIKFQIFLINTETTHKNGKDVDFKKNIKINDISLGLLEIIKLLKN